LIPTDHPDLTPFQWTIYSNYAPELTVELPYDTPLVDVDGELIRAIWLLDAATTQPPPSSLPAYFTADQTRQAIADALNVSGAVPYEHTQSVPQSVWTINHQLGRYPVSWSLFDADGALASEYLVQHLDLDTSRVSMDKPSAGLIRIF